ncbi:MAG: MATE family efflux transporter [Alphaproteobacteria bacterium]
MYSENYHGANLKAWSAPWIRIRAWRHFIDMLKLSPPIIASRLAGYFLVVVDIMMVLRYSPEHNQWLTAGAATSNFFIGATFGFTVGVPVLVSRYFGAKEYHKIGDTWRQGILWSVITGGVMTIFCIIFAKPILNIGNPDFIDEAFPIAIIYALSFIPNMIWMVGSGVLEGSERPIPVFILSIFGNLVNILLNWLFVYGIFIFPEMGAIGSAIASLSVRVFMAIITTLYLLNIKEAKLYNIKSLHIGRVKEWVELRVQGYAAAVSIFFEAAGFSLFGLYAVRKPLTQIDTAAFSINMNILASIFMIGLGFAAATGVRVGVARGRKDFNDQIFAVIMGVLVTLVSLAVAGFLAFIYAKDLANIFTADTHIIAYAASFTIYLLWIFIPDGIQAVLSQSLRTSGITWLTTIISTFSYGIFTPILAFILTFNMGHGIKGIFQAIIYGSWLTVIGFFILFIYRYKNMKINTMVQKEY